MILRFVFLCGLNIAIAASSINAYLELVLVESGVFIDGPTDIVVSVVGPKGDIRWKETHIGVNVFNGVAAFQIGNISPIQTHHFYDEGVQLKVAIKNESISLPLQSTPFSLFSHAADVVNAIHMDGVFHTDLESNRIGIALNVPTPSTLLEVNGALRVSNTQTVDEIGGLRWRNFHLEGRHNHQWQRLDIGPGDDLETKWLLSAGTTSFYSMSPVRILAEEPVAMLTVSGNIYVDKTLFVGQELLVDGRLNLPSNMGVSSDASVLGRSLFINPQNQWNASDGLMVSGQINGNASGLFGIDSVHIGVSAIQGHEITRNAIASLNIQSRAITNDKIMDGAISSEHLAPSFKLLNEHFMDGAITSKKIKPFSIQSIDLSPTFELTAYHFSNGVVVSNNIGNGYVGYNLLDRFSLEAIDFSEPFVDSSRLLNDNLISETHLINGSVLNEDFKPGALLFDHFNSEFGMNKGGTGQTNFGGINNPIMVVSNNQMVSVPAVLNAQGLGLYADQPVGLMHVLAQSNQPSIRIESTANQPMLSSGIRFENQMGQWFFGVTSTGNLEIYNYLNPERVLAMNHQNGHVGIGMEPGGERLSVNGAVVLGHTNDLDMLPGTMYFSTDDGQFKWVTNDQVITMPIFDNGEMVQSTFYLNQVTNQSIGSRVLLANRLHATGHQHSILGAFNATISGRNHLVSGSHSFVLGGDQNHLSQALNSVVVGNHSSIQFAQDSHVSGAFQQASHLRGSLVIGKKNSIDQLDNGWVNGDSNRVLFAKNTSINGGQHLVHQAHHSSVNGVSNQAFLITNSAVEGEGNGIQFSHSTMVNGGINHVGHSHQSVIVGSKNHISHALSATIIGDANHLMHSSGTIVGVGNRHIGKGAPRVFGSANTIIGHSNASISANRTVVFGSSKHAITTDESIHFFAPGGVDIVSGNASLAVLEPNGGSWSHVSDRSLKMNIRPVDPAHILEQVVQLPIMQWHYNGQQYVRHIGPMAQDFYQVFHLGSTDRYIQTVDMDGVIFSAIQGLGARFERIKKQHQHVFQQQQHMADQQLDLTQSLTEMMVSSNALMRHHKGLNKQFEQLHKKEHHQSLAIDRLGAKLMQMNQRLGVQP